MLSHGATDDKTVFNTSFNLILINVFECWMADAALLLNFYFDVVHLPKNPVLLLPEPEPELELELELEVS